MIGGAIFVLGTLFERWRYNNKNARADADWQVTGERFVDPATGKVMEVFYEGFNDPKYRPAPLLKEMVAAGRLGRKTGMGFYSYGKPA